MVALLTLSFVATQATAVPFNDAGSGMDAGDTPDTALLLAVGGAYMGAVDLPGDEDWYRLLSGSASGPLCARGTAQGLPAELRVQPRVAGVGPTVAGPFGEDVQAAIGVARLVLDDTLIGIVEPQRGIAGYAFSIDILTPSQLGPGDGGSGGDAGHTPSTALPVPDPCISGGLGNKDRVDAYKFEGAVGDQIVMSFAAVAKNTGLPQASYLTLVRPDFSLAKTIGNAEIASFTLDQDGTWYLGASSPQTSNAVDYTLGTCIPYCVLL